MNEKRMFVHDSSGWIFGEGWVTTFVSILTHPLAPVHTCEINGLGAFCAGNSI
jgi:hypothetical protein